MAIWLGGCAAEQQVTPLAYRFSIAKLEDGRSSEEMQSPVKYPFDQQEFITAMGAGLPYSIFGSAPAGLDLTLTHYEATSFNGSYAVSMVFKMSGKDAQERGLARRTVMCSSVQQRGFELLDYGQQVVEDKNLESLTPEARDRKMWHRVFDACVQELARKFGQALVETQTMPKAKPAQ
jgi:hypothetical protein